MKKTLAAFAAVVLFPIELTLLTANWFAAKTRKRNFNQEDDFQLALLD